MGTDERAPRGVPVPTAVVLVVAVYLLGIAAAAVVWLPADGRPPPGWVLVGGGLVVALAVAAGVVIARPAPAHHWEDATLETLLDDVPEGIYRLRVHPTAHVEYANRAIGELTGYDAEAFAARPDLVLARVHPQDRHLVEDLRRRPGTAPQGVELRWQHRDGRWRWFWLREVPVRDADGRLLVVYGAVSDVTVFKDRTARLRAQLAGEPEAADLLEQMSRLHDDFFRSLTHELRTPLAGILGFTRLLLDHDELDPGARAEMVQALARSTQRLQALVEDLLDLDRVESSETVAERRPVDVAAAVTTVVTSIPGANVVTTDLVAGTATVDPRKLERIVTHLLHNSARHTPPGTPVHVRTRFEGGALVLVVEDEGPGVPEPVKRAAFAPFVQGRGARVASSPGVGIGLAVVSRYARLHGGEVVVGDRPGGGARFTVRLPLAGTPSLVG